MLNHGVRAKDSKNLPIANIAMDIVVNHMLLTRFGFKKSDLSMIDDMCLVENIWEDEEVSTDENFEHYYNKLIFDQQKQSGYTTLDDHSSLENISSLDNEEFIEAVGRQMTVEDRDGLSDLIQKHMEGADDQENNRGISSGSVWSQVSVEPVQKKKKWETVIKEWSKKYDKKTDHDVEQWARVNRRFAGLNTDFFLPTEMEEEKEQEGKIEVWFFQDTSGSCYRFRDRFFTAAKSLPTKRFDIKMFCFDTSVYETSLQSGRLYGFGGTSFSILEEYVQNYVLKHQTEYPKAVFVITDGYGDYIEPKIPQNWYFFLSPYYTRCIPQECNTYDLRNFE